MEPICVTAARWGVSRERVRQLCREGRIPAFKQLHNYSLAWHVPAGTPKPKGLPMGRPKRTTK